MNTLEEIRAIDPRDRTDAQRQVVNEFHDKALAEFYHSWGVGDTDEHKARFWDKYLPHSHVTHVERGSSRWVRVMELCWMTDQFPQDAIFC